MFTGEPPDRTHDWVLQISREGHKASMLKSYRFDSREGGIVMQEDRGRSGKVPFDVIEPSGGQSVSLSNATQYSIKMKRETKALQHMMYRMDGRGDGR